MNRPITVNWLTGETGRWKMKILPHRLPALSPTEKTALHAPFSSDPLFHDELRKIWQLQNTYIVCETNGGFLLIHQQAAHERILYEKFMLALNGKPLSTQTGLFATTLTLSTPDAVMLQELLPALQALGYQIEPFGKDSFIIQGAPAGHADGNEKK